MLATIPTTDLLAELARRCGETERSKSESDKVSIALDAVCDAFDVAHHVLTDKRGTARACDARCAAYGILREIGLTNEAVAKVTRRSCVAAVTHGLVRFRARIASDKFFARKMQTALEAVKSQTANA